MEEEIEKEEMTQAKSVQWAQVILGLVLVILAVTAVGLSWKFYQGNDIR